MALEYGRLVDAMYSTNRNGIRQAVLLIDEQGEKIERGYLISYQTVLSYASRLNCRSS